MDTLIKSQVLYQLSYGSIVLTTLNLSVCGCKSTTFFRFHNAFYGKNLNITISNYKSNTYLVNQTLNSATRALLTMIFSGVSTKRLMANLLPNQTDTSLMELRATTN